MQAEHVSVYIARAPTAVYEFASDPRSMPRWDPMRVLPNGDGSEFVFTLFRRPGMSPAEFAEDRTAVERDLRTLKGLLEGTA